MRHIIRTTTGALLAGMIAAGCATSPPPSDVAAATTAINNAGQAIDQAAANPQVAKYATSELERATGSLNQAKVAWGDKQDLAATTHFAYIAQQRAATAQELANARASEDAVRLAAAQRDQGVSMAAAQRAQGVPVATAGQEGSPAPEQEQRAIPGFAVGRATLPATGRQMIEELASTLKDSQDRMVVIEGHTDNVGSPAYNQALALQRAEAVRAALIRRGVDTSRIIIRSLGEQVPVASNDDRAGRRENRRAQVIVTDMDTRMVGSSQGAGATTSSGGDDTQGGQGKK